MKEVRKSIHQNIQVVVSEKRDIQNDSQIARAPEIKLLLNSFFNKIGVDGSCFQRSCWQSFHGCTFVVVYELFDQPAKVIGPDNSSNHPHR